MTITKSDIVRIFGLIKASYDNAFANKTESELNTLKELWYDCLKEYPQEIVFTAVRNAIKRSEFVPKIATVNAEIERLVTAGTKSEIELWNELETVFYRVWNLSRYLRYSQHYANAKAEIESIYNGLSSEIKLYVLNNETLIELAAISMRTDGEDIKFEKARFLKSMPSLKAKQADRRAAEQFLQLVGGDSLKLLGVRGGKANGG